MAACTAVELLERNAQTDAAIVDWDVVMDEPAVITNCKLVASTVEAVKG
jgi:hypothetical protein